MAFYKGFYAYAIKLNTQADQLLLQLLIIIVHTQADQLLPQLLLEQFDTFPIQWRHIEYLHEGVWLRKKSFWHNDSFENLENFFPNVAFVYALMVLSLADQLQPQLLMEQFDTFLIQFRHIKHIHEFNWFRKNNF